MKQINIPHNLRYRDYQKPLVEYMRSGGGFLKKRACIKWHRRCWKDKTFFNITVEAAIREKGGYAYILPTYSQWRKIIWDSIDKTGLKFKDHIPKEALAGTNGTELKFNLKNGSFIQILWSDNIDSIRGTNWKWVVFSEYAFQNPTVWDVLRPILAENDWWAIFNSTPNGENHFFDLYEVASKSDYWFSQSLTVDDTWVVSKEYIEQERKEGMTEEMIQQEYYVSFDVGAVWSYYADLIKDAKNSWRITQLPKSFAPVDVYFDLWRNDATSVWFKQDDGLFFNFIHHYESSAKHITKYFDYIDEYLSQNNLQLGSIKLPHDSTHQRVDAEKSSFMHAQDRYGPKVVYIERTTSVQKDIDRVRELLPRCRFDIDEASHWVKCLKHYHKKYNEQRKVYSNQPEHDWSSHAADAFRYFAVTEDTEPEKPAPAIINTNFDSFI